MTDSTLVLTVATDKLRYAPGDPITVTMAVMNRSGVAVTLNFSTGQRYDFTLKDSAGKVVWQWAAERMFTQVLGEETIVPGGELVYREQFTGRLAPGSYRIVGTLVAMDGPRSARATVVVGN